MYSYASKNKIPHSLRLYLIDRVMQYPDKVNN